MEIERPLTPGARRILDVASRLFYERGIHAVGVDLIAAESGVTKRTLYDRFGSKDALVTAYLVARGRRWRSAVQDRSADLDDPAARVLAPFDVLPTWVAENRRGCAFVNASAELPDPSHSARHVIRQEKRWLREFFGTQLAAAGAAAADDLALVLVVLHDGALAVSSTAEMPDAVAAARRSARALCDAAVTPAGPSAEPREATGRPVDRRGP